MSVPTCHHTNTTNNQLSCPFCGNKLCSQCLLDQYPNCHCTHCSNALSPDLITSLRSEFKEKSTESNMSFFSASSSDAMTVASEKSYHPSAYANLPNTDDYITYTTDQSTGAKVIKFATLEMIIQQITTSDLSDQYFIECFIFAYPLVCDAEKLLDLVIARFDPPRNEMKWDKFVEEVLEPVRMKVVGFIHLWLKECYEDFTHSMIERVEELLQRYSIDKPKATLALTKFLQNKKSGKNVDVELVPVKAIMYSPLSGVDGIETEDGNAANIFTYHYAEFSRQLTLVQQELFRSIPPTEFLAQGWLRKARNTAPNITKMIRHSNSIAAAIQNVILSIHTPRGRALAIHYFIQAALSLKKINNYDGLKCIMAALGAASIYRLKASWILLPTKTNEDFLGLEKIVAQDGNFAQLRILTKISRPPAIPFLGSTLTDLVFTNDGNTDMDEEKIKFNFYKIRSIGNLIKEIRMRQVTLYSFEPVEKLQNIIQNIIDNAVSDEEKLFELSNSLEPKTGVTPKKEKSRSKDKKQSEQMIKTYGRALSKSISNLGNEIPVK
ncbi:Ras GTP exchange factor [Entamoeba marina]